MSITLTNEDSNTLRGALDSYYGEVSLSEQPDGSIEVIIDGFRRATLNTIPEKVSEAVAKGARLLSGVVEHWYLLIDFDNFDIDDTNRCPLGQVFGPMADALNAHEEAGGYTGFGLGFSLLYEREGFSSSGAGFNGAYGSNEDYRRAWAEEARRRR